MKTFSLLAALLFGVCFTPSLPAKDLIECKSPDGRFALHIQPPKDLPGEELQVEIIDLRTKQTALELDCHRGYESEASLVWSADSKRVAYYNPNRRGGDTEVYFRNGTSFTQAPLPDRLPPLKFPRVPSPDEPNKVLTTIFRPVRWLKSGALVLYNEDEMLAEGSAAQEMIIGFDKDRKASVLKATPKDVPKEIEPPPKPPPKLNPVPCTARIIAGHDQGSADGLADQAQFTSPDGITADASGNIYVADTANQTLRRIKPDRTVETVAGAVGQRASVDGTGEDARFSDPRGLAIGPDGNIYVADCFAGRVRKVTPQGVVTTVAKDLHFPRGLAVDGAGVIYVNDGDVIRKIDRDGTVTLLAGQPGENETVDGPAKHARFDRPCGIAVAPDGSLYVVEAHVVRKIDAHGVVTTLAGPPHSPAPIRVPTVHGAAGAKAIS